MNEGNQQAHYQSARERYYGEDRPKIDVRTAGLPNQPIAGKSRFGGGEVEQALCIQKDLLGALQSAVKEACGTFEGLVHRVDGILMPNPPAPGAEARGAGGTMPGATTQVAAFITENSGTIGELISVVQGLNGYIAAIRDRVML